MIANYSLVAEARAIALGLSDQAPTRAHLLALVAFIESMTAACDERADVIHALLLPPVTGPRLCV